MFYKDDRLAIFIDGANLYAAAKSLGFDIDYKLLRQEFDRRGKLMRAYYYTALMEGEEYSPIRPLVDWLHYNGYCVVTKAAKEYTDTMGRRKIKGNMDIELTIDAMQLAPRLDHAVIFSGDGDFRPLIEALQRQGVRVSVVSTIRSQPPTICAVRPTTLSNWTPCATSSVAPRVRCRGKRRNKPIRPATRGPDSGKSHRCSGERISSDKFKGQLYAGYPF